MALFSLKKSSTFLNVFFLLFSIVGMYLSVIALKNIFGVRNNFIDNLCDTSIKTSCNEVISSKKWRILKYISFSDLSLLFFANQVVGMIVFFVAEKGLQFFMIQNLLLYCSIPFIFLSIFYQKFIERKWCIICILIIFVLVIELFFLNLFLKKIILPDIESFILLGFVFFSLLFVWQWLKDILLKQKKLQEFFIRGNRLSMDYNIFKNTLVTGQRVVFPNFIFEIGNSNSDRSVTISTNPFCVYCRDAHQLIEKIINKHSKDLSIRIILNIDLGGFDNDDWKKEFCKKLVSIYYINVGEFIESLRYWFDYEDVDKWNDKYGETEISENAEEILMKNHLWGINNRYQFTPAIFIDEFPFPRKFDREYLPYYIEEVLNDDSW